MCTFGFFWGDGRGPEGREGRRAHRIFSHCCLFVKGKKNPTLRQCDLGAPAYLKVGSFGCEEFGSGDGPLPQSHGFFLFSVVYFRLQQSKTSDAQQFAIMFVLYVSKSVTTPPPMFSLKINLGKYLN